MSEPIVCPNCKILNPPQAQVCDCGHIIGMVRASESAEVHNLASANRAKWKIQVAAAGAGTAYVAYLLVKFVVRILNQMNGQS